MIYKPFKVDPLVEQAILKAVNRQAERTPDAYDRKPLYWTPPKRTVNPFRSLWDSLLSNI